MLSQLSKTIKLALGSSTEERAILRARSAVQRFPVVEWRQKIEDFHKRSIVTSRHLAGEDAWRESDCSMPLPRPNLEDEDWTPEVESDPSRPEWAAGSLRSSRSSTLGDNLNAPSIRPVNSHYSETSSLGGSQFLSPYIATSRSSTSTDVSDGEEGFATMHSQRIGALRTIPDLESGEPYGDFLARANRQIAKETKHVGDPFIDDTSTIPRPFGSVNSRRSSVDSISSIVDEKPDSPLNKAMASVSANAVYTE